MQADLQNARQQKGYLDSLIRIGDAYNNEAYTHRCHCFSFCFLASDLNGPEHLDTIIKACTACEKSLTYAENPLDRICAIPCSKSSSILDTFPVLCRTKVLKRHGQETISLLPRVKAQSQLLNDVVGSIVAAIAMIVAVFGLWIGYRLANFQLDIKFVLITVVIYSIKDRIKVSLLCLASVMQNSKAHGDPAKKGTILYELLGQVRHVYELFRYHRVFMIASKEMFAVCARLLSKMLIVQKWGERYLEPVAKWFGFSFPDRIVQASLYDYPSIQRLCMLAALQTFTSMHEIQPSVRGNATSKL